MILTLQFTKFELPYFLYILSKLPSIFDPPFIGPHPYALD